MTSGSKAFHNHQRCQLFEGFAPAKNLGGGTAIKFYFGPEELKTNERERWIEEWEEARLEGSSE